MTELGHGEREQAAAHEEATTHHQQPNLHPTQLTLKPTNVIVLVSVQCFLALGN